MVVPDIFCVIVALFSLCTKVCISSDVPGRKHRITVRFRGHPDLGVLSMGPAPCCSSGVRNWEVTPRFLKKCVPLLMYVYTVLSAYKETYGNNPVWSQYRRNHKGAFPPRKTRKTCIVSKLIVDLLF
jgi:hypothetical protein